ncbi:hypothetical protein LOTGIDRAFT_153915 [Lottia gigantea]|uniref:Uncharacterized protein n=1 Tax=Lottia gigantea TaxID=225164 RepID=V4ADS5_LOTGI|nr:hypothetical protein LOTGIDRAFT_153915 [Lottia gigantea]ESO91471.1 hypothetical protein LOTGIDRAFT_153915 [Lottia gigantea]
MTDDIKIRLTTHCCPAAHNLYSAFQKWYSQAVQNRVLSLEMKCKMNNLIQKQSAYYQLFNLYLQQYHELLSENLTKIQVEGDNTENTPCISRNSSDNSNLLLRRQVAGDILQGLKTSRNSVEEMVQLVKENTSIIERFEALSLPDD